MRRLAIGMLTLVAGLTLFGPAIQAQDDPDPDTGAAANRQAVIQQAVERSEVLDMARLALTVDVKWGSYDPDGILPGDEEPPGPAGTSTSTP